MAYETEDHETQYCFPAINSSCIKGKRSSHEYNIMYVFFSLLSAWTVFVNLLVIISISHFKKLHTPTNLIILSLALVDLLTGLIVMPVDAIKLIETCWYFGDTFCGLFMAILGVLLSASLSNLVLVAIDRYVAVCHPLQYPQKITITRTIRTICLCWICSSAYITALSSSNGHFNTSNKTDACYGECYFMLSFTWTVIDLFMSLLFPCILIITLYLRIFYVVHQQVKVINALMKGGKCVMEGSVRRKSESKAALTLGIIVAIHILCWLPIYIFFLTRNTVMSSVIMNWWVYYINSGLNPLIYALFYPWFRRSFKHILSLKIFQSASSLVDIFTNYHS
ncbi:trace amine-associated receptor 13c-like [Megalobrama amblycephala]|uniref:trace amine-associated receptor 13c-like n=1 Tax=Megalobrama amblycephala TaxID=75352 RepID=UPI002013C710|nr:trace amine-associated receptor 13c-like [Megalobrama amblycephala]XP_048037750.1 trace amine-associated receptor 13c-like [Megalobrama amblycephala]